MNVVLDANQVESGDIEDEVCGGAVKKTDLSYVNSEKYFGHTER